MTVGTEQYQFNALMHWIELLMKYQLIDQEIIVQYGTSTYLPDGARAYRKLSESDLLKFVDRATLIISHCDEAIAQFLEDKDTPYVLVPRLQRFREYIDNHQMEVADDFERRGIAIARSPGDLVKFIKLQQTSKVSPKVDETQLCEYLRDRYQPQKLMLVCAGGGYFRYMQSLKDFWETCSNRLWVSVRSQTTEEEIEDADRYWGFVPVKNNPINFFRNCSLATKIISRHQPDLVISTGSSFALPYLILAKWLCGSKVIYIESKTRLQNVGFPAWFLLKLHLLNHLLDLVVVRSETIAALHPRAVYIPVSDGHGNGSPAFSNRDYKQVSVVTFDQVAFIFCPENLIFVTARQFFNDFQSICNADEEYRKIIIDMSHTAAIDSAGLGVLTNCLRIAALNETELILWSVSEAMRELIGLSSLSNLFIMEHESNTFRFAGSIQKTKVSNITPFNLFLFRLQRNLRQIPFLGIFHPILKFIFPWVDVDPSVPVHPSVRDPIKRLIDIIGALIGLSLTAILFVPIAITIILESEGGVIFGQIRCGLLSKPFRIWKFRSMVKNAEQLKQKVTNQVEANPQSDQSDTAANDKFFKNADDPRVTKIGKFLRKTSLDEFPQFWNVLIGDMSLVGTRPPTFNEINSYELEIEYHDERYTEWNRLDVRPGITGLWQVNGRSSVRTFGEVVNYDIEYRKNWSVWYDLKLIVKTVLVLFDKKNKAV